MENKTKPETDETSFPRVINNPELAKIVTDGQGVEEWVEELRKTYPQDRGAKVLSTYRDA